MEAKLAELVKVQMARRVSTEAPAESLPKAPIVETKGTEVPTTPLPEGDRTTAEGVADEHTQDVGVAIVEVPEGEISFTMNQLLGVPERASVQDEV